jgi:hypothetical protein
MKRLLLFTTLLMAANGFADDTTIQHLYKKTWQDFKEGIKTPLKFSVGYWVLVKTCHVPSRILAIPGAVLNTAIDATTFAYRSDNPTINWIAYGLTAWGMCKVAGDLFELGNYKISQLLDAAYQKTESSIKAVKQSAHQSVRSVRQTAGQYWNSIAKLFTHNQ